MERTKAQEKKFPVHARSCLASGYDFIKAFGKNETMYADCLHELCIRLEASGPNDFIRNFSFDD